MWPSGKCTDVVGRVVVEVGDKKETEEEGRGGTTECWEVDGMMSTTAAGAEPH